MKILAMEESFSVPGMATKGAALHQPSPFRPSVLKSWERRLPDFTEYRLKDMDANGVDVQVLSLTSPGVQMQPDAAIAVSDAQLANDVLATATLLAAAQAVGIDNVLFAIDYPYESSALAVEFLHALPLNQPDLNKIAHGNAERLLRI